MGVWDADRPHEQVVFCADPETGLRAIIAIYSTALGPALGGTRFFPYPEEAAALADVRNLAMAMAYKNAVAGLDLGGGKAVILGDPATIKTEALLRAYARFVEGLHGRYVTACDVGTNVEDMDVVARETRFVTGRSTERGGAGDSGVLTAYGVYQGMRAAATHRWGEPSLAGRRVGVSGVGKVGSVLVTHLLAEGAQVTVADVDPLAVNRVCAAHPEVEVVDPSVLAALPLDVYAPCALGGALTETVVDALTAEIICGGANNQLASDTVAAQLAAKGVLYAPDFVVNAGGVIAVADEYASTTDPLLGGGYSPARAQARVAGIYDTTLAVLRAADEAGVSPVAAANAIAERRMAEVGRLRRIYLP